MCILPFGVIARLGDTPISCVFSIAVSFITTTQEFLILKILFCARYNHEKNA
jgi:hypothetical protein